MKRDEKGGEKQNSFQATRAMLPRSGTTLFA